MSKMLDEEINEYSDDFIEAWEGYFAQPMYYVEIKLEESQVHPIYSESKKKIYDFENKRLIHGKFLQQPYTERGEIYGRENYDKAEISFITKELTDKGVLVINQSSVIEIFDNEGTRKLYNIIGDYGKVQIRNHKMVTRLIVSEVTERERTNIDEESPVEELAENVKPTTGGGLEYL